MTPTLIAMLKAPVPGTVKTRLAAGVGPARATAIYRDLVVRTLRAVPPEWHVAVHFAPRRAEGRMRRWLAPLASRALAMCPQARGNLGTRLAAAFAGEFARGAPAAIVVGGDCPGLDRRLLRTAAAALLGHDAVLGPAADGGYYLLGLKAPAAAVFAGIAWSTPQVLAQTRDRLRAAGLRTRELPVREDVDDVASWRRAVAAGLLPATSGGL